MHCMTSQIHRPGEADGATLLPPMSCTWRKYFVQAEQLQALPKNPKILYDACAQLQLRKHLLCPSDACKPTMQDLVGKVEAKFFFGRFGC